MALPAGNVTFLFTDVEGSTRLLREMGAERYAVALAEHRRVLRAACSARGGLEVDTQGDAFFFAFPEAREAVTAAERAVAQLAGGPIRVRFGLHTGAPILSGEGYVGEDVHLGARVAAAAHGGQVVLSKATRELVDGVALIDLGEHRLKDFPEAVWIYQLGGESFPPLKTISNTNLPRPVSSFVGRAQEVAEVVALVHDARLVTLGGPGGSGKTRLAIEAAAELVPEFRNGVFWVGLASLHEPALVAQTIAHTLGAKDGLTGYLGERELLLLLDNLEQVIECAPELAELLESCPRLKLLITSREVLRIPGEAEYPVLPLAEREAVELFAARSRLEPDEPISELCRRLDNLPLAVELAAARASVLSPQQILDRMASRLDLLKGGRGVDPRQQTLRATIEWSHSLLSPGEQQLFAHLAVFVGGCLLDAAEAVCGADLDTLQTLVDKSLVRRTGERFWMLETIRDFAVERLDALGDEAGDIRRRLAEHLLLLAREAQRDLLRGLHQRRWHAILDAELDNVRAVLAWGFKEDPVSSVELAAALGRYWWMRGPHEGTTWLERAAAVPDLPRSVRAEALEALGGTVWFLGEAERTGVLVAESLELYREIGDPVATGRLLNMAGPPLIVAGRIDEAERVVGEAVALNEELGAYGEVTLSLQILSYAADSRGDLERAAALLEDSIALAREHDILWILVSDLLNLCDLRLTQGALDAARDLLREALSIAPELGDELEIVQGLGLASAIAAAAGDDETAGRLWGAAERPYEQFGQSYLREEMERYRQMLAGGGAAFEDARRRGRLLTLEEGIAVALGESA